MPEGPQPQRSCAPLLEDANARRPPKLRQLPTPGSTQQQQQQQQQQPPLQRAQQQHQSAPASAPAIIAKLKSYAHVGDVASCEQLVRSMWGGSQEALLDAHNFLVQSCVIAQDAPRAKYHLQHMEECGPGPNLKTYTQVMNACAISGDVAGVKSCLQRIYAQGLRPNSVVCGIICKLLANEGDSDGILTIMDTAETQGIPVNEYFYRALIKAYGAKGAPDTALILQTLHTMQRRGLDVLKVKSALEQTVGAKATSQCLQGLGQLSMTAMQGTPRSVGESKRGHGAKAPREHYGYHQHGDRPSQLQHLHAAPGSCRRAAPPAQLMQAEAEDQLASVLPSRVTEDGRMLIFSF